MARTAWAAEVMVRLDDDFLGMLQAIQSEYPGLDRASACRKAIEIACNPPDVLIRYRLPPEHKNHRLFPEWRTWGPFAPGHAIDRAQHLTRKGYQVEMQQVIPDKPRPQWDGDMPPDPNKHDSTVCEACGAKLVKGQCKECDG